MMKKINTFLPLLIMALSNVTNAQVQQIDMLEFGQYSAFAVRAATWIDHYNQRCNNEQTPVYENQTDFILNQIGGRSSQKVRQNAAVATKTSPEYIKNFAINETNAKIAELGGCKSKKTKAWIDEAKMNHAEFNIYLTKVADLYLKNGGPRIFK